MGIDTYYLSKRQVTGVGSIFLLNELIEEKAGGGSLLGAVVQENKSPFHTDYPVPILVSEPNIIIKKLELWKKELNITSDIVEKQKIAAGHKSIKVEKNNSFQVGLGPFPGIPFNGKFQLDYSRVSSIDITYGTGTTYKYIRKGDMMKLYRKLKGKPDDDMTGNFLRKNAFISLLQVAKNWKVSFESTKTFDAGVEAQIDLFNNDSAIGGSVKMKKTKETRIEAEVGGDVFYVVGLMSTRWDDVKPD
ncbi:MAG: hypothetical protein KIS76_05570 [Pyrinomonadaceae bacterium]|nr:hypothetical protein [Pyrinomonadaceae bacterium]